MDIQKIREALVDLNGWLLAIEGRDINHYLSDDEAKESLRTLNDVMAHGHDDE